MRSLFFSFCLMLAAFGCGHFLPASGLSIDMEAGEVSWQDSDSSWTYTTASGDWAWTDITSENVWTFDAGAAVFEDAASSECFSYDSDFDVWVKSLASEEIDLVSTPAYDFEVWRYVSSTKKWHPLTRTTGSGVAFVTQTNTFWLYDPTEESWLYTRTGGVQVPTSEEWSFRSITQSWQQITPSTDAEWTYVPSVGSGAQWHNTDGGAWSFVDATNSQSRWQIVDYDAGPSWDMLLWSLNIATGVWNSQLIKISPPDEGTLHVWHYDSDDFVWKDDADSELTESMPPFFAPTPFAPYKAIIEDVITRLQTDGAFVGSSDGTGLGLVDEEAAGVIDHGKFIFNDFINRLTFTDTTCITGDIELNVQADGVLVFGEQGSVDPVFIIPSSDAPYAQLIFNVADGKTLEVQVLSNVYFKAGETVPLVVSFRGKGTTVFRLPSGRTISFGPDSEDSAAVGVQVQILMDLLEEELAAGINQVVFQPWSYAEEDSEDEASVNTATSTTTRILFGTASSVRFLSYNETGVDGSIASCGSVAFDVCHDGIGRTILDLSSGIDAGDSLDAGFNLFGSLIVGSGEDGAILSSDLRTGIMANKRAGNLVRMSIIDSVAYTTLVGESPSSEEIGEWVARAGADRRGLVIVNRNKTYPMLAANLERAVSLEESSWAEAQSVLGYQPGFVIGENGQLRISHNLFLDYVAASANQIVNPEQLGGAGSTEAYVKQRNPSALIIDKLGSYGPSDDSDWDMTYEAHSVATVVLEGTAGLILRAGASSATGDLVNMIYVREDTEEELLDATIGKGLYNGSFCPVLDDQGVQSTAESLWVDRDGNPILEDEGGARCLDGEHVLVAEGDLAIVSVLGRFGMPPNGYVTLPSLYVDHTGREVTGELA